jgi:predicted cupin superfamily sugar epimerase
VDAADVIRALDLSPLPEEGGFFRETYRSAHSTAILYLLDAASCSLFHRLAHDEVWHFHAGDPVELWLLRPDGTGERVVIGADLAAGHVPQAICPAGTWEAARLVAGGRFALMGCTVAPPFRPEVFETARRDALLSAYPGFAAEVAALTPEEGPP